MDAKSNFRNFPKANLLLMTCLLLLLLSDCLAWRYVELRWSLHHSFWRTATPIRSWSEPNVVCICHWGPEGWSLLKKMTPTLILTLKISTVTRSQIQNLFGSSGHFRKLFACNWLVPWNWDKKKREFWNTINEFCIWTFPSHTNVLKAFLSFSCYTL